MTLLRLHEVTQIQFRMSGGTRRRVFCSTLSPNICALAGQFGRDLADIRN